MPRLLHATPDAVFEATNLAEGATGWLTLHAAGGPASAALAAIGGEDGLGDLQGGRVNKNEAFDGFPLEKIGKKRREKRRVRSFCSAAAQKAKKHRARAVSRQQRPRGCGEMPRASGVLRLRGLVEEKRGRTQEVARN